jgi:hypothetical protein
MLGAFIAELIRIVPAVREGKPPTGWELLASLIQVLIGAGAVLFGWTDPQPILKVAVMGAAFPLLFSAAVNGAKPAAKAGGDVAYVGYGRSVLDYFAGRF